MSNQRKLVIDFVLANGFTVDRLIGATRNTRMKGFMVDDQISGVRVPSEGELRDLHLDPPALLFTRNGKRHVLAVISYKSRGVPCKALRVASVDEIGRASFHGAPVLHDEPEPVQKPTEPDHFLMSRPEARMRGISR